MYNKKYINVNNMFFNMLYCKSKCKNICVMVKANAYGHGLKQIVSPLKNYVKWFGVSNYNESINVKKLAPKNKIIIVGKTNEYNKAIKNNISFSIDSLSEIVKISKICQKLNKKAYVHVAINTGMNRIGVKDFEDFKKIINFIKNNKYICLEGIFTHFFDSDIKNNHYKQQLNLFKKFVNLTHSKNLLIHIGGSFVLNHSLPNWINMVRVGYFIYGYGNQCLKPVMTITSKIIKITNCDKNEFVGYGKRKLLNKTVIATIPIGYADGLSRRLSNKYYLIINGKKAKIIGNICMDMCMVDITNINCKVGDEVLVLNDVLKIAKIVNTSPYESLINFQSFRGKSLIV